MAKESGKKRQGVSLPPGITSCKQKRRKPSLLDDCDYGFDSPAKSSEWNKLYDGSSSEFDDLDFDNEYCKAPKASKDKPHKRKSLLCDDKEDDYDEDGSSYFRPPQIIVEAQQVQSAEPVTPPPVQAASSNEPPSKDEVKCLALQMAEKFARQEDIKLVGGALYAYNGKFYYLLDSNEIQRMIFANYRTTVGQANTVAVLRNAAVLLMFCVRQKRDEFPANSHLIVFENGTLEVNTGRFRKNSPDDLATSALSICFDPSQKKMPWTKQFLSTIADGDDDLYELMLQVIGYILSNDVKAKSFFYLEGAGDAGKSRFCDLIASFFPVAGPNKVARVALQELGGKFALGNLVNAKLNISEDLPDSPLSPTTVSRIKMISDANRLEAEAKYVQPFSFRPLCKLLFASNHPLRLKEYDAAFVNRVVYIPFLHPIPKDKQDKDILEKMQRELPALFNHAFRAYRRLVANGYVWAGAERFKPNISIANSGIATDKELELRRFVRECCEFGENYIIATTDLQSAYEKFCRRYAYLPIQGDRFSRELSAVLPDTVSRVKIGNQRRGFRGIQLKVSARPSEFDNLDEDLE